MTGTELRANIIEPDVRVIRNQKGYVARCNGQAVVTADQVIVARCCPGTRSTVLELLHTEPGPLSASPVHLASACRVARVSGCSARSTRARMGTSSAYWSRAAAASPANPVQSARLLVRSGPLAAVCAGLRTRWR
jgi:hypothetical protein